ncbi:MAG TPA: alcohol dehydrogenase, partial [Rhodospirillaceae bacterium]|nr:alcohol dehydrogenase [Rhodospirillaceae bacterium]
GPACPGRPLLGAQAMGASVEELADQATGDALATRIEDMMRATGIPNGLNGVGYSMDDLDNLVSKAAPQRRLLDNAPLAIAETELRQIFTDAMHYW